MNKPIAIGTYVKDGNYGVWAQIPLMVADRRVLVDIEVTPPVFDFYDARLLAREIHDRQVSDECELLLIP